MSISIDFETLRAIFVPYLDSLKNFHFTFLNPLFWAFLLVLLLILLRFWEIKKSFSFCLIIAVILLGTTKLEDFVVDTLAISGESLVPFLIRVLSLFAVAIVFLYCAVIKDG